MNWEKVKLEQKGAVALITLNRPQEFNALDGQLGEELIQAIEFCRENESIRAVVITGAGKAFSVGGDLKKASSAIGTPQQSTFFRDVTKSLNRFIMDLRLLPKPVIAAVNGAAGGAGFTLALACDLRLAAASARFKQAYTSAGLTPDGAFTYLAGAVLGLGRASELLLLDPVVSAEQALALGLVHRVVADEELPAVALQLAEQLAAGPTLAFGRSKALLNEGLLPELSRILELERQTIMQSCLSEDYVEGVKAFFEKRKPEFRGR